MKIVLWRMAHDCLPTGSQLKKRHILDFDACCFCGREETVEHVFFMCPFASEIWRQVRKCFNINYKMHASANIRHWLFDFLEAAEMKQQFLQSQYGTFGSQEMQLEMVRI